MENNTTLAVRKEQRNNPFKRAFSAISGKCRKIALAVTTMLTMSVATSINAFNSVVGFFATWIGRIGLVVAFVGGVMFALAIKNDDAEAKTRGLMTLASGFVVFALTLSLDLFGIT